MKIRRSVLSLSALVVSAAFCVFQTSKYQSWADPAEEPYNNRPVPGSDNTPLTMESVNEMNRRSARGAAILSKAKRENYRAKQNNGSRRGGIPLEELPEDIREDAAKLADEYKQHIYPELQKYIKEKGEVPHPVEAAGSPQFRQYMLSPGYLGTGQPMLGHLSWSIGAVWRLDGSIVNRDLYSKSPEDAPHDVWARNSRFTQSRDLLRTFLVVGWDDGRVTFERCDQLYTGIVRTEAGKFRNIAFAGQAGIPPGTLLTSQQMAKDIEELKKKEAKEKAEAERKVAGSKVKPPTKPKKAAPKTKP